MPEMAPLAKAYMHAWKPLCLNNSHNLPVKGLLGKDERVCLYYTLGGCSAAARHVKPPATHACCTAAEAMPDAQRFMTKDELLKFLGETQPEGFSRGGQVRGYSEGGIVGDANFPTDDFDPDRIDSIVAELHAMNAG
jgi:hypothetical protein